MRFPIDRVIRLWGCCVSTGGNCSSGRRRVSLASLYPSWMTRDSLLAVNIRGRASPVSENCHVLMCGTGQSRTAAQTVNWREIAISLIDLVKGERKAQASAIAWLRKPSRLLSGQALQVVHYFRVATHPGTIVQQEQRDHFSPSTR